MTAAAGTLAWIRRYYGLDVKRGDRVLYQGAPHIVCGGARSGPYLRIRPEAGGRAVSVHPTWEMQYPEKEKTDVRQ